jgi:hypothetical protein
VVLQRVMKFFGFRVRRFPLWLVIFNGLCAAAAVSILLASGLLVTRRGLELVTPRGVNLAAAREVFRRGDWRRLVEDVRRRQGLEREALAREIGALCEPETLLFLKGCEEIGLVAEVAAERGRWDSLAPELWRLEPGRVDELTLLRDAGGWRHRLLRWSVLWGDELQGRIAIEELAFDAGDDSGRALRREDVSACAWAALRGSGLLPVESERLRALLSNSKEPDWVQWRGEAGFSSLGGLSRIRCLEGEMRAGVQLDVARYEELASQDAWGKACGAVG